MRSIEDTLASATAHGVAVPCGEDGWPLADSQVLAETLERFPDLRMSFDEFLTLDEDFNAEWIDGRAEIRPTQTNLHHVAMGVVSVAFRWWAELKASGRVRRWFAMRPASGLPCRVVDILYLADEHAHRVRHCYVDGPADLVVEVIEAESRQRDTVDKFREYERGGVREYWLIDPAERKAQVFRLHDGRYEPMPPGDPPALRSEVLPGFWLNPEWIWNDRDNFEIAAEWGLI